MKIKNNQFGDASITWREPMTADEVSDLEQLIEIWMRGIKRRVEVEPAPTKTAE